MLSIKVLAMVGVIFASLGNQATSPSGSINDDARLTEAQKEQRINQFVRTASMCIIKATLADPRVHTVPPGSSAVADIVIDSLHECVTESQSLVSVYSRYRGTEAVEHFFVDEFVFTLIRIVNKKLQGLN